MVPDEDTKCGFHGWYPKWLQIFASKKSYCLIYGLIGMGHFTITSYFTGTVSTIEKRFKIPSQTAGYIVSAMEIGYIAVIFCSYMGSTSHKARWVSYGGIIVTLACFTRILPHLLYGPGQDAILLSYGNYSFSNNSDSDYNSSSVSPFGIVDVKEDCSPSATSIMPTVILILSQVLLGMGFSSYWSLGVSYMDDNARKDKIAILVSLTAFIKMLGPTIGFYLASYSLEMYIDPSLKPKITINDPRWIGAWWYAWIPLGIFNLILSAFMAFFPKTLPRAAIRMKELGQQLPTRKRSLKDFIETIKRLFQNKLLLLNTCSTLCYMFGMTGYWVFLPKYMESQFQQSASRANIVTGSVGLVFTGLGLLVSGSLVTYFKPPARFLAGWNMCVETLDAIGHYCFVLLGCPVENFHGTRRKDNSWDLITDCNFNSNCTSEVKYDPVCDLTTNTTFYSPCHAGCQSYSLVNSSKVYTNCSCADGSSVVLGSCPVDCEKTFLIFVILMSVMRFTSSTGRAGNSILQFRSVSPHDKALSIGLLELFLVLFSFMPGPIIYGMLLDSVCLVWGQTCGKQGNCWLYDGQRLRFNFNMTASTFLLGAAFLDLGVCYYAKGLKLYDDLPEKTHIKDAKADENTIGGENETEELLVLRACQSPVIIKKSDVEEPQSTT